MRITWQAVATSWNFKSLALDITQERRVVVALIALGIFAACIYAARECARRFAQRSTPMTHEERAQIFKTVISSFPPDD